MICNEATFEKELSVFMDDATSLVGNLFWPERAAWLTDFEGHISVGAGGESSPHTQPLILLALRAVHEFVTESRWDEAKGAQEEFLMFMEIVLGLLNVPHFGSGSGEEYPCISATCETGLARWALDCEDNLTLQQVALLAKKAEGSLRNAAYNTGPDKLVIENGIVSNTEARRWLLHRTDFQSTSYYNSAFGITGEIATISSLRYIPELIRWRSEALDIPRATVLRTLDIPVDSTDPNLFETFGIAAYTQIKDRLRDVMISVRIANLLRLDPTWFARRVGELIAQHDLEDFLHHRESEIDKISLHTTSIDTDPNRVTFVGSLPVTAERVRLYLRQHPAIENHPAHSPSNVKMHGYITLNGQAIAVEHNLKHPAFWVESIEIPEAISQIRCKTYPASDVGKNGKYGRHSGLRKFPELIDADLLKFVPRKMEELESLINVIIQDQSS